MNISVTPAKLALLLFLTALVVYWRAAGFDFVLDDFTHIVENADIRTIGGTLRAMLLPTFPGDLYRPLVTASYGATFALFGSNPVPYHLTNLFLHSLNSLLLFMVLRRVFPLSVAGWSALLFTVLPIHSEAVANIHGRTELLSACFGFIFLLLLPAREPSKIPSLLHAFALAAMLFLAISAKESAVAFPLLALLLLHLEGTLAAGWLIVVAATIASVVPYLLLRIGVLGHIFVSRIPADVFVDNPLVVYPWYGRVAAGFMLLGKYLVTAAVPWRLSADYSFAALEPLLHFTVFPSILYAVAAAALIPVLIWRAKMPHAAWFAAWFFITFSITGNIFFPIGTIFGERLCYLPSVAVCGLIVIAVERFGTVRWREWLLGIIAVSYSAVTMAHLDVWENMESLARYQVLAAPGSVKSAANFAVVLRKAKNYDAALVEAKRAEAILPTFDQAPLVEATIYLAQKNDAAAEDALQRTLALNPDNIEAIRMLGVMNLNSGAVGPAEQYFHRLLAISPGNFEAELGLFATALKRGKLTAAGRMYRALKQRDPENPELIKLGAVLNEMQQHPGTGE